MGHVICGWEGNASLTEAAVTSLSEIWRVVHGLLTSAGLMAAETHVATRVIAVDGGASGLADLTPEDVIMGSPCCQTPLLNFL